MVRVRYYDFYAKKLTDHIGEVSRICTRDVESCLEEITDQEQIYMLLLRQDEMTIALKESMLVEVEWPIETGIDGKHFYTLDRIRLVTSSKPDCNTIW